MIWEKNVRLIQKHNLEADRGVHTYTLGINKYADMVGIVISTSLGKMFKLGVLFLLEVFCSVFSVSMFCLQTFNLKLNLRKHWSGLCNFYSNMSFVLFYRRKYILILSKKMYFNFI